MKLCFLADADHTNTRNWVEYFANDLGHAVSVITFRPPAAPLRNVRVLPVGGPLAGTKYRYVSCIRRVRAMVASMSVDVLVGYRVHSYGFTAAMTGFHPLALAAQGQYIYWPRTSRVARWCARHAIGKADLINSWGEHMTARLLELGAPAEKIVTVPRGVRLDRFVPRDAPSARGRHELVCTRGLNANYQIDVILRAVKAVLEAGWPVRLTLAGEGVHRAQLESLAAALGLGSAVRFVGRVPNDRLPAVLRDCDLYVSMVRTDGVSASLLEAMACGLFPIVTDNTANRLWITDAVNGYLVPAGDDRLLAGRIVEALAAPALRATAAEANRSIVEQRADWRRNMAVIEGRYLALARGRA